MSRDRYKDVYTSSFQMSPRLEYNIIMDVSRSGGTLEERTTYLICNRYPDIIPARNAMETTLQPAGDLAAACGRRISLQTVYSRLAEIGFTPDVQSGMSLWLYSTDNSGYCGAENINHEQHRNGDVLFAVMSRNVPDKMILIEC
ncbi:hypothetical protein TNCV_2412161 [Trichonephila clavipes]|nr:hypothetical protein TNCV_2412161 [Trichonephila clavipes]